MQDYRNLEQAQTRFPIIPSRDVGVADIWHARTSAGLVAAACSGRRNLDRSAPPYLTLHLGQSARGIRHVR